jgi:holo-[acyl-carrier protein] synthase
LILGVGIDIADCRRFRRSIEHLGEHFIERVYTCDEAAWCRSRPDPFRSYASIFAVKEAVMKALEYGLDDGASFREIEVDTKAGVQIRLSGKILAKARELGMERIHASLSSDGSMVVAAVTISGEYPGGNYLSAHRLD